MKKLRLIFFTILGLVAFWGCEYNFIVPEMEYQIIPDDGGTGPDISFATSVEPVFNSSNNCTACHRTGGTSPDLTTGKAYASISNSKYINLADPEASKIYSYLAPNTSTHTHKKYTAAQAATVLNWIKQGAKNN